MICSRWGFSPSCTFPFAPFTLKNCVRMIRKPLPYHPDASVCQKIKYCDVRKGKTRTPSGGPRAASWHPQARETDQSGGPTDQPAGQSGCGVPQGCPGNMITGWYAVVGRTWPSCRLAPRAGMVQLYDPLDYTCSHGVRVSAHEIHIGLQN